MPFLRGVASPKPSGRNESTRTTAAQRHSSTGDAFVYGNMLRAYLFVRGSSRYHPATRADMNVPVLPRLGAPCPTCGKELSPLKDEAIRQDYLKTCFRDYKALLAQGEGIFVESLLKTDAELWAAFLAGMQDRLMKKSGLPRHDPDAEDIIHKVILDIVLRGFDAAKGVSLESFIVRYGSKRISRKWGQEKKKRNKRAQTELVGLEISAPDSEGTSTTMGAFNQALDSASGTLSWNEKAVLDDLRSDSIARNNGPDRQQRVDCSSQDPQSHPHQVQAPEGYGPSACTGQRRQPGGVAPLYQHRQRYGLDSHQGMADRRAPPSRTVSDPGFARGTGLCKIHSSTNPSHADRREPPAPARHPSGGTGSYDRRQKRLVPFLR